ncbi:hypothetical protein GCM10020000_06960 [Streptomyces olivoverticillatus]
MPALWTSRVTARRLASATLPPTPAHGGWTESHHVAQDDEGRLWADGTAHPKAAPSAPRNLQRLLTWSEHGLAVYVPRDGYRLLERIDGPVDERWVPIASVMPELPAYARDE